MFLEVYNPGRMAMMSSIPTTSRPAGRVRGWEPQEIAEVARLFPSYEMLRLLGRGGMGAVSQARQTALYRLVAIKLLPLEISVDAAFAAPLRAAPHAV